MPKSPKPKSHMVTGSGTVLIRNEKSVSVIPVQGPKLGPPFGPTPVETTALCFSLPTVGVLPFAHVQPATLAFATLNQ